MFGAVVPAYAARSACTAVRAGPGSAAGRAGALTIDARAAQPVGALAGPAPEPGPALTSVHADRAA